MICPSCHADNRPERRYCHGCAAPLSTVPCPDCGFVNHPGERYCGGCAREVGTTDATPPERPAAEWRQLTVMFCDMVGSTALSARLDAEDLRDVITRFQGACAAEIARHDGYIARYMGDGMLVYFGYPRAREDNAERAVHAGLAILGAVARLGAGGVQPHVRVGIATGRVVVGDLVGEGASEEHAVVGETPNLAARLQALAEPDTVVLSPRTRRLVGPRFEVEDLGEHRLRGFPEPIRAWRAVRPATRETRRAAAPLVGRRAELGALRERWEQVRGGRGAVVSVVGATGIGKTRLVEQFQDDLAASERPARQVPFACWRHQRSVALHPLVDQVSNAAGIELHDPPAVRREKVEGFVGTWSDDPDRDAAAMRLLLALDDPRHAPTTGDRRTEMLRVLWRFAVRDGQTPALVVFEDVHWADPSTLELLGDLVSRADEAPLMVLTTHRPDFEPPWGRLEGGTVLSLGRLASESARALVTEVGPELAGEVADRIVQRADGVPGFLVELTRAVAAHAATSGPAAPIPIPETLQDSLTAQLDRMGPARRLAQTAAVIGRRFSRDLLQRVTGLASEALDTQLEALVDAGLVSRIGGDLYGFRQSLLRDVAYESLLRRDQRALHEEICDILLEQLPDAAAADPVAMARQLQSAGRPAQAAHWWRRAADQAANQAAWLESVSHFGCAIEALEPVTDRADPEAARALAELYVERALKLRFLRRFEESFALLDQARDLATPHALHETLSHVFSAMGNLFFNQSDVPRCLEAHERAVEHARLSGSPLAEARAVGGLADASGLAGDRRGAVELFSRCVDLAMAHGFTRIAAANAPAGAFSAYWALRLDEALRLCAIGEQVGAGEQMTRSLVFCRNAAALVYFELGRFDDAAAELARLEELPLRHPRDGRLPFTEHRAERARGDWHRAHEVVAAAVEAGTASRVGYSPMFDVINQACLLAEAPQEEFDVLLASLRETLPTIPRNYSQWSAVVMIDALLHRRAWDVLRDLLPMLTETAPPGHSPLVDLWLEIGRAALAWGEHPEDPAARAALDRVREVAVTKRVGIAVLAIDELLAAAAPTAG